MGKIFWILERWYLKNEEKNKKDQKNPVWEEIRIRKEHIFMLLQDQENISGCDSFPQSLFIWMCPLCKDSACSAAQFVHESILF